MQNIKQNSIALHDIKPLIQIHEYSMYYFIGICIVAALVFLGALYLLYRWYKNRKRFNKRAHDFKILHSIKYEEPKKAAYDLTMYGATFKDDDERHLKAYENMLEKLEKYKYRKNVENFDADTIHVIDLFKEMIDV